MIQNSLVMSLERIYPITKAIRLMMISKIVMLMDSWRIMSAEAISKRKGWLRIMSLEEQEQFQREECFAKRKPWKRMLIMVIMEMMVQISWNSFSLKTTATEVHHMWMIENIPWMMKIIVRNGKKVLNFYGVRISFSFLLIYECFQDSHSSYISSGLLFF